MDPHTVPPPLAAALLDAGYRVGGPAGVGGGGPVWTAVRVGTRGPTGSTGPPGGPAERVVVHVVGVPDPEAGARLVARLEALGELEHPHLPEVVDVVAVPAPQAAGETWAVLLAEVPGATVGALLAARGRLTMGEVVTLTVPVAGALDALHRVGLVHGDVSPANILVRPDGRPVLIDVLGGAGPAAGPGAGPGGGAARGTPGFTAPELTGPRAVGCGGGVSAASADSRGHGPPAAAPADVFALACVALAALDLSAHDGRLGEELRAACAPEPVRRPTAAELAAALYACADPEPIEQPDAGVLARTALAQLAAPSRTVSVPTGARHRAGRRRVTDARRRVLAAAGTVVLLSGVAWGVLEHGDDVRGADAGAVDTRATTRPTTPSAGPTGAPSPATPPRPVLAPTAAPADPATAPPARDASSVRPDPVEAATALTRRRVEVLASGEPARLAEVEVPGSPAHRADAALLDRLAAFGTTLEGVSAVVEGAALDTPATTQVAAPGASTVDVRVRAGLSVHDRQSPSGTAPVPTQAPRSVVLRLRWTDGGWRVVEVLPG